MPRLALAGFRGVELPLHDLSIADRRLAGVACPAVPGSNAGRRFHHRFSRDDAAGSVWNQSAAGVISPTLPGAAPGGQKPGVLKRIGSEIETE
jgi:hypothetical protein